VTESESIGARARRGWVVVRRWTREAGRLAAAFATGIAAHRLARPVAAALGTLLTLGVTAYVFYVLNRRFFYAYVAYDEEFFAWGGWCIRKGLAPYRDFIEFKPPMVFITHAWAQALFGLKNQSYRWFFALFPLASLLALQGSLIARRIPRLLALAVTLGIISLFVNPTWHDTALSDAESIGLSYYMFGVALLLWEGRFARVTTVLGGLFLSCAVFSKEPFGPIVVATWVAFFWLRGHPRPSRNSVKAFATYSLLGVGIFIVLLSAYMVPTGAMKAYLRMVASYNAIYSDPKRSYCVALGIFHPTTPLNDLRIAWGKIRASFLNENVLGFLFPILIPGLIFALRRSWVLLVVLFCAAVAALWAAMATKCMWVHYYNMSMAGVIVLLVVGTDSMKDAIRNAVPSIRAGVGIAAVLLVGLHMLPDLDKQRAANHRREGWNEPQAGLLAYIKANTTPSDRIFTSGPPFLYPQSDRISAVRETNIIDEILGSYDGATDQEKLRPIYLQLVKNKPKVVFLDPENGHRKNRHKQALLMPFLEEFKYKKINENLYLRP
jgi:hypothetical protein